MTNQSSHTNRSRKGVPGRSGSVADGCGCAAAKSPDSEERGDERYTYCQRRHAVGIQQPGDGSPYGPVVEPRNLMAEGTGYGFETLTDRATNVERALLKDASVHGIHDDIAELVSLCLQVRSSGRMMEPKEPVT